MKSSLFLNMICLFEDFVCVYSLSFLHLWFVVINFGNFLTSVSPDFFSVLSAFLFRVQLYIFKIYLILHHIHWYIPNILAPR